MGQSNSCSTCHHEKVTVPMYFCKVCKDLHIKLEQLKEEDFIIKDQALLDPKSVGLTHLDIVNVCGKASCKHCGTDSTYIIFVEKPKYHELMNTTAICSLCDRERYLVTEYDGEKYHETESNIYCFDCIKNNMNEEKKYYYIKNNSHYDPKGRCSRCYKNPNVFYKLPVCNKC